MVTAFMIGGINVISRELAKRLKDAGLEWKKQEQGDWFYHYEANKLDMIYGLRGVGSAYIFAPRLDQLLGEIERREYKYKLEFVPVLDGFHICSVKRGDKRDSRCADTTENAVALALLWILKEG